MKGPGQRGSGKPYVFIQSRKQPYAYAQENCRF